MPTWLRTPPCPLDRPGNTGRDLAQALPEAAQIHLADEPEVSTGNLEARNHEHGASLFLIDPGTAMQHGLIDNLNAGGLEAARRLGRTVVAIGIRGRSAVRASAALSTGIRAVSELTGGAGCRSVDGGVILTGQLPPMSGPQRSGVGQQGKHAAATSVAETAQAGALLGIAAATFAC